METPSRSVADVLIVTENFIEAADIGDAIPFVAPNRVVHIREVQAGLHLWQDTSFAPILSVMSYRRGEANLDTLAKLLIDRGSVLLLLDPTSEVQSKFDCLALSRPFTAADLARTIGAIDFGNNRLTDAPNPA